MIHIAFGDSAAGCLRQAIKLGLPGDAVIVSRDDFTQGPISDCISDGGLKQRVKFWQNLETLHPVLEGIFDQYKSTLKGINSIDNGSKVILWIGDSAHDKMATAWILTYLAHKNVNWYSVDLASPDNGLDNNVVNLAMLLPKQVVAANAHVKSLSESSIDEYLDLWTRLSIENTAFRIKKENEIHSVNENYHDEFILSHITKKEQFLGKLIGSIMKNANHRLTDITIESRLLLLQSAKKIKVQLNMANVFLSKVRLR